MQTSEWKKFCEYIGYVEMGGHVCRPTSLFFKSLTRMIHWGKSPTQQWRVSWERYIGGRNPSRRNESKSPTVISVCCGSIDTQCQASHLHQQWCSCDLSFVAHLCNKQSLHPLLLRHPLGCSVLVQHYFWIPRFILPKVGIFHQAAGRVKYTEGRINLVFNRGVGANNSFITYWLTSLWEGEKKLGKKKLGGKKAGEKE